MRLRLAVLPVENVVLKKLSAYFGHPQIRDIIIKTAQDAAEL